MRVPRRALFALAAALGYSGAAGAQPEITRQVSPGGLPFRHVLMADQPMQSLQFAWIDTRALTDPGKEALASLGPSLVMQGPEGSSPSAMAEDLRDFQASMSLSSNGSHTRGWLNAPLKSFSEASAVLRRTLATPALPQDRLIARQRNAAVASRQAAENPDTLSRRLLGRLMLGDSAMTRLASGDPESYARITRADIANWARETFVRAGLEIVMAGPMPAKDAGIIIDEVFGALPQGEARPPSPPRTLRASGKLILLERPVAQTIIAMAGPTTLTVSEHFVRADMMVGILGGGSQSRLFRSVRDRLGAAYGVSTTLTPTDSRGFALSIRTAVANDRAKEALAAIREDYARFLRDGVTAAEVDPLRTRVISNRAEALRRSGAVASLVLNAVLFGLPEDAIATYARRVAGYSLEEFNGELRHFPAPPLTTVVIAPSAEGFGADCVIKSPDEISRCE